MIDGRTSFVGIIGRPLTHTFSPFIHNYSFKLLKLNWVYLPFPVPSIRELKVALDGLKILGCRGLNVTAPYKEAVIPYMDEMSDTASMLEAVNTILFQEREGKIVLKGENTDLLGFSYSVAEGGFELSKARYPLVIGAGGAARSVLGALVLSGCQSVCIVNRSKERAEALIRHFEKYFTKIEYIPLEKQMMAEKMRQADLLIHTTPTGTYPNVGESIIEDGMDIPSHLFVVDLVYNPIETKLIKQARKAGSRAIGGLGMLYHQAAIAFEYWTGEKMPLEKVKARLKKVIAEL